MSIYSKLCTGAASMFGGVVGQGLFPTVAAPLARKGAQTAMTWMWGASKGIFDTLGRNFVAEQVGFKAFQYAQPVGGVLGTTATLAAIEGGKMLYGYAKNQAYLRSIQKLEGTEQGLDTFELDNNNEGFIVNKVRV